MNTEDGGPAFPCGSYDAKTGYEQPPVIEGMSLRDWFAGQALAGLSANPHFDTNVETMAEWAWTQADAMLAARNTEEESD